MNTPTVTKLGCRRSVAMFPVMAAPPHCVTISTVVRLISGRAADVATVTAANRVVGINDHGDGHLIPRDPTSAATQNRRDEWGIIDGHGSFTIDIPESDGLPLGSPRGNETSTYSSAFPEQITTPTPSLPIQPPVSLSDERCPDLRTMVEEVSDPPHCSESLLRSCSTLVGPSRHLANCRQCDISTKQLGFHPDFWPSDPNL